MKHLKLFESMLNEDEALKAYNDMMDLVSMYDGYISENWDEGDDRYWGNVEELNAMIDEVTSKIKNSADVLKNWDAIKAVAQRLVDGADGYLVSNGDADRYLTRAQSKVRSVKKMFGIK